jgi:hypothetical protein
VDTRRSIFLSSRDIVQECQLFVGSKYVSDSGDSGDFLRGNLRITAHDHYSCFTVQADGSPDELTRLHGGLAGDGTSVDTVKVGLFAKGEDVEVAL